jgi:hypothetical protein
MPMEPSMRAAEPAGILEQLFQHSRTRRLVLGGKRRVDLDSRDPELDLGQSIQQRVRPVPEVGQLDA